MKTPLAYTEIRWRPSDTPGAWRYKSLLAGATRCTLDSTEVERDTGYTIQARNVSQGGAVSDWVTVTRVWNGHMRPTPAAPTGMVATALADGIQVVWTVDNTMPSDATYYVEMSTDNVTYTQIGSTKAASFHDGRTDGATYYYRVWSVTFDGMASARSAAVSAKAKSVADGADNSTKNALSFVTNPYFEAGDQGWVKGANWTIVSDPANSMGSTWVAKHTGAGASTLANNQVCPVTAGQEVLARAYVRALAGATGSMALSVNWLMSDGTPLSSSLVAIVSAAGAATWCMLSGQSVVAPATACFARLSLYTDAGAGGTWCVDNTSMTAQPSVSQIPVAQLTAGTVSDNLWPNSSSEVLPLYGADLSTAEWAGRTQIPPTIPRFAATSTSTLSEWADYNATAGPPVVPAAGGALPAGYWHGVAWSGVTYCAVASGAAICATSPDGVVWTQHALPLSANWWAIAWNGSVFCAIATGSATCVTSPDGVTWTQHASGLAGYGLYSVAWNGSVFCAIASGSTSVCFTSPDGVNWVQRVLPSVQSWSAISSTGGVFLVVSGGGGASTAAAWSLDGVAWTTLTFQSASWIAVVGGATANPVGAAYSGGWVRQLAADYANSAQFPGQGSHQSAVSTLVPCAPGDSFYMEAQARILSGPTGLTEASVWIYFHDATGAWVGESNGWAKDITIGGAWQKVTAVGTAPAGAVVARLSIRSIAGSAGICTAQFDAIYARRRVHEGVLVPPTWTVLTGLITGNWNGTLGYYTRDLLGNVAFKGYIAAGPGGATGVIFTLPVGSRPGVDGDYPVVTSGGGVSYFHIVAATGVVSTTLSVPGYQYFTISPIRFLAEL